MLEKAINFKGLFKMLANQNKTYLFYLNVKYFGYAEARRKNNEWPSQSWDEQRTYDRIFKIKFTCLEQ